MATINHPLGGRRALPLPVPRINVNGWILAAVLVVGLGAMLPVLQNSVATSRGFDSQVLDARQARLESEIRLLESDVARLTSLERIERRAKDIGLTRAEDPMYVEVSEPGPAPAKIPAEYLPSVIPGSGDNHATWLQSVLAWLPLPR